MISHASRGLANTALVAFNLIVEPATGQTAMKIATRDVESGGGNPDLPRRVGRDMSGFRFKPDLLP